MNKITMLGTGNATVTQIYIQPMSDGMGRELAYLSSHATNRYFIPNWGKSIQQFTK